MKAPANSSKAPKVTSRANPSQFIHATEEWDYHPEQMWSISYYSTIRKSLIKEQYVKRIREG